MHKHMWCQLQKKKNCFYPPPDGEEGSLGRCFFGRTSRQQFNFVSALWHFDHTTVYSLINKQYIRGSMTNNKKMIVIGTIKLLSSEYMCIQCILWLISDFQYASMCLYIINMLHMFILVLIGEKKWGNEFVWKFMILSGLTTTAVNTWISNQVIVWKIVSM